MCGQRPWCVSCGMHKRVCTDTAARRPITSKSSMGLNVGRRSSVDQCSVPCDAAAFSPFRYLLSWLYIKCRLLLCKETLARRKPLVPRLYPVVSQLPCRIDFVASHHGSGRPHAMYGVCFRVNAVWYVHRCVAPYILWQTDSITQIRFPPYVSLIHVFSPCMRRSFPRGRCSSVY
jgi:hypothetical protein